MAAYTKQTWDTTSVFNPTRMNHIEQGIYDASTNIVDNLTSTDATKALSAKQGKVLNDNLTVITPKGTGSNIDTQAKIDGLTVGSTVYGYVAGGVSPFGIQNWATIQTIGIEGTLKNQSFISVNGIAFRHWESGSWGAWKKVSFS